MNVLRSDRLLRDVPLYPLRFEPIYKNYIWGGSRFRTLFCRRIPDGFGDVAESWEVSDLPDDTSIISNGVLCGYSLNEVLLLRSVELLGAATVEVLGSVLRFPMLLKYLDANSTLSIQVHPDDLLAAEMQPVYSGKSEAWVVIETEPDGVVWIGTEGEYSKEQLQRLIIEGGIESVMRRIGVKCGDCFYIPPGTLHSLGAGVMVAEIQQPSNTTFRVFDWNRVDRNGSPRQLHKNEAIAALRLTSPLNPIMPQKTDISICELLVVDPNFLLYRWTLDQPIEVNVGGYCSIWTVFSGTVHIEQEPLNRGESILFPATQKTIKCLPLNNKVILGECTTNNQNTLTNSSMFDKNRL
ncbi:MAG: class I mannose-6-phosphate isomerase [Planctomycetaceae bacterium]|jgi:mannose-6-phosphate isomerase|nr:class I mannose-6-phosphate isomerase [Planctomycetaceae bacterium]